MKNIYIKSLDNKNEFEFWNDTNLIAVKALEIYLKNNKISNLIINTGVNNEGFFIDFETEKNISEKQFELIEGKVKKILLNGFDFNSKLKTKDVKFFKLKGVSGLKIENKNANRLFGFATLKIEDFEKINLYLEELESRDHRKIGKELDLFYINDLSGKGLPIWLPNGVLLKKQIKDYIWDQEDKYGSEQIETPVLGSIELYKTSGHYFHYKENMFPKMQIEENETFILRPMACPHHVVVYKRKPRSYKDLPIRFSENVKQYRYESSGSLIGLERVRAMELTDSHIFLREDQLENEIKKGFELIQETLNKFDIDIDYIELALHDSKNTEKYHGNKELWIKSEKILKNFLISSGIKYVEMIGEAAFYGPKIDVQIKTVLGHNITVSTIQLDFLLPERFDLSYINSDKSLIRPIMIHRGLIGTYERFISILLEQTKGDLPMWIAPQQAIILPINSEIHMKYSMELYSFLKKNKIRVKIDDSDERLSNKIRIYQTKKVKTQIIIGDEEVKSKTVTFRFYGSEESKTIPFKDIIDIFCK